MIDIPVAKIDKVHMPSRREAVAKGFVVATLGAVVTPLTKASPVPPNADPQWRWFFRYDAGTRQWQPIDWDGIRAGMLIEVAFVGTEVRERAYACSHTRKYPDGAEGFDIFPLGYVYPKEEVEIVITDKGE